MKLLYKWLRDHEAPLYGRAYLEVRTRRLSKEESLDFLEKGFTETGYEILREELEEAVDRLDGVIGWLTLYSYSKTMQNRSLNDVLRDAVESAKKELENFLMYRVSRDRYKRVLKLLAQGVKEWGKLDAEGKPISDRVLHDILYILRNHSIID